MPEKNFRRGASLLLHFSLLFMKGPTQVSLKILVCAPAVGKWNLSITNVLIIKKHCFSGDGGERGEFSWRSLQKFQAEI